MSNLKVNTISNISNKQLLADTGNIVQTIYVRTDARNTWSSNNRYQFTPITSLTLDITPKRPQNMIIVQCSLFCEIHHDNVMTILRDYGSGDLMPGMVENRSGNFNPRHSGMIPADYTGNNNDSTPRVYFMQNTWIANTNSSIRFTPGVRGSGGGNYVLYLNRCQGSNANGQNSYEIGYSTMIAWEVTQ